MAPGTDHQPPKPGQHRTQSHPHQTAASRPGTGPIQTINTFERTNRTPQTRAHPVTGHWRPDQTTNGLERTARAPKRSPIAPNGCSALGRHWRPNQNTERSNRPLTLQKVCSCAWAGRWRPSDTNHLEWGEHLGAPKSHSPARTGLSRPGTNHHTRTGYCTPKRPPMREWLPNRPGQATGAPNRLTNTSNGPTGAPKRRHAATAPRAWTDTWRSKRSPRRDGSLALQKGPKPRRAAHRPWTGRAGAPTQRRTTSNGPQAPQKGRPRRARSHAWTGPLAPQNPLDDNTLEMGHRHSKKAAPRPRSGFRHALQKVPNREWLSDTLDRATGAPNDQPTP
ncbi:hypothetical protein BU15DRAFT_80778 [Melanogaster broomeanus]|nr:hypothetical protein BU15DRAFT_80778 [Melanogaster broomeanus]